MKKIRLKFVLAVLVSVSIVVSSFFYTAYATGALQEYKPTFTTPPATLPGDMTFSEAQEIVDKGISAVLQMYGLSERSVEAEFYNMMYQKLKSDECHLSYHKDGTGPYEYEGTYCLYSAPGVWNENYLTLFIMTLSSAFLYYDANQFWEYSVARLAAEYSSSKFSEEEYVQKEPISIKSDTFKDVVNHTNTQYFPKNAAGKMSYRTDSRYQNCRFVNSSSYNDMTFYDPKDGFVAVGGGDDIYIVLFYMSEDNSYYSKYQLHFTVTTTENWYEDRDEIEYLGYNLDVEYWDMVNESYELRHSARFMENQNTAGFAISYKDSSGRLGFPFYGSYESYSQWNTYKNYPIGSHANDYPHFYEILPSDLSSTLSFCSVYSHFRGTYENHDQNCNVNGSCDIGYIASLSPISMQYNIDTTKIPDNYYITISGDTVYDYSITNPETGQSDTINNYITNNYSYVTNNNPGTGSGSDSVGNITVGGKVEVGGSVGVDINVNVPDININVNQGNVGGGDNIGDYVDTSGATTDIGGVISKIPELSKGFTDYLKDFFAWLPTELYGLIVLLLVVTIWKAVTKR